MQSSNTVSLPHYDSKPVNIFISSSDNSFKLKLHFAYYANREQRIPNEKVNWTELPISHSERDFERIIYLFLLLISLLCGAMFLSKFYEINMKVLIILFEKKV